MILSLKLIVFNKRCILTLQTIQKIVQAKPQSFSLSMRRILLYSCFLPSTAGDKMNSPKEVLQQFVKHFNNADVDSLVNLYSENAVNHQVANEPIEGKAAIKEMFEKEFAQAEMTCIVENIFEDGEWAIMEWKDPLGLRGCGFFQVKNGKIIFQRGYWDKLSFLKMHNLPIE